MNFMMRDTPDCDHTDYPLPRPAGCSNCEERIGRAATREGWRIVGGVVVKPCELCVGTGRTMCTCEQPDCFGHPGQPCGICNGTGLIPAGTAEKAKGNHD